MKKQINNTSTDVMLLRDLSLRDETRRDKEICKTIESPDLNKLFSLKCGSATYYFKSEEKKNQFIQRKKQERERELLRIQELNRRK